MLTDNLAKAQEAQRQAHLRHALGPHVSNRFSLAFGEWRVYYEAKAALQDRNLNFAATLLPKTASTTTSTNLLPITPAGVRREVLDNKVNVTVDVAGAVTIAVQPPTGAQFNATVVVGATRQATTFPAVGDGLYKLTISANGTALATVYVSVQRKLFLAFREWSAQTAFAFKLPRKPKAPEQLPLLLALIYGFEAAAATGQVELYTDLVAAAKAVEKAPTPRALFRHG